MVNIFFVEFQFTSFLKSNIEITSADIIMYETFKASTDSIRHGVRRTFSIQ